MKTITIDGVEYDLVPKEIKTEVDILKENYNSGNYVLVRNTLNSKKYFIDKNFYYQSGVNVKLIHKKHKEILNAWLKDNSIDIEYEFDEETYNNAGWYDVTSFIEEYKEHRNYRLKQQYPIFKRNEDGEVFRFDAIEDDGGYGQWVLHKNLAVLGVSVGTTPNSPVFETIPYDKERGLYHLQPVWFKGDTKTSIGFYSVTDRHPLTEDGFHCIDYKSIEPITQEQLKVMPFVWEKYQQVLKDKQ